MRFLFDDETTDQRYLLFLAPLTPVATRTAALIQNNEYEPFTALVGTLEDKLGVLDWSCGVDDLAGFTSYEIDDPLDLMQRFKAWFKSEGFAIEGEASFKIAEEA